MEVPQRDRQSEDVGNVARPPHVHPRFGVSRLRRRNVPVTPRREPDECRRSCPPQVVVGTGEAQRPPGMRGAAGPVAEHQRLPGAVHGDPRGKGPEPLFVDDHHVRRSVLRSAALGRHRVQPPLGAPEVRLNTVDLTGGHEGSHVVVAEHRPGPKLRFGEGLHPAPQGVLLPEQLHGRGRQLDHVRCAVEGPGCQGVVDGDGSFAVLLVPGARAPVQRRDEVGLLVEQAGSQHVGEQVVVAVPPATVVQRHQEQVGPVQRLQHRLAAAALSHGVAERTAQPVEDGGTQQERLDLLGRPGQHLLDQVVDDVSGVAREAGDELGDVHAPLHRQRRQLEGGDPPLGATLQRRHVRSGELQAHHAVEVRDRLLRGEAQVRSTDLDQLASGPEPSERQRRIGAAGTFERLPYFFGGVLLMSLLLLMLVFRSVVVPVKAVVMNLLATSVALGVLALAVSGGPLGDLVGIPEETPIPVQLPIGIFAVLFGLSMDYEIFLLSRIKEEYDRTGDNAVAVADGLAKSAPWLDRLLPNIHLEGHEVTDEEFDLRDAIGRQRGPIDVHTTTGV